MTMNLSYLYLLSPLHTGGASQEGNLVGIARESHTNLPYAPSSTVRGRLRASTPDDLSRITMFGPDLNDLDDKKEERKALREEYKAANNGKDLTQLEPGNIWIGDASILWMPVPSLSHGVIWVSCPMLLKRWARIASLGATIPSGYETNLEKDKPIYLKDAILSPKDWGSSKTPWQDWKAFGLDSQYAEDNIPRVVVLPDAHCQTLIQMSLWRQVKIKLDRHKTVDGGFRYEEAIPPDTLMYFPWGTTAQANGKANGKTESAMNSFRHLLSELSILQLGGQESLGRGFVQQWATVEDTSVA